MLSLFWGSFVRIPCWNFVQILGTPKNTVGDASIKLAENVIPTIQGRDFVVATVAAPTIIKEPEKPAEETAEETAEEGAEGATEGVEGEEKAAEGKKEGEKKEAGKEADKKEDKKAPVEKK